MKQMLRCKKERFLVYAKLFYTRVVGAASAAPPAGRNGPSSLPDEEARICLQTR